MKLNGVKIMVMNAYNNLHSFEETAVTEYNFLYGGHNGVMAFTSPSNRIFTVVGGPYINKPDFAFGVKMAAEINLPCDVSVPTNDYSVPDKEQLRRGLIKTLLAMNNHNIIYVGCMGGIGRTGLFIAALVKIFHPNIEPVLYTRANYLSCAVETLEQQRYIADLYVDDIRDLIRLM